MKEKNIVYLIEKLWIDEMATMHNPGVGYSPFGFVYEEEKAKEICEKGKIFTPEDSYLITHAMPEFRYKPLELVEE